MLKQWLNNRNKPRVKISHKADRHFTVRNQIAYYGIVAARVYMKAVERKIYEKKQQAQ